MTGKKDWKPNPLEKQALRFIDELSKHAYIENINDKALAVIISFMREIREEALQAAEWQVPINVVKSRKTAIVEAIRDAAWSLATAYCNATKAGFHGPEMATLDKAHYYFVQSCESLIKSPEKEANA